MKRILSLFIPHEVNNYRATLLQYPVLLLLTLILLAGQIFLFPIKKANPDVLGVTIDVKTEELLFLTNQQRQKSGLAPLTLNQDLSQAASLKAQNMFSENYWAHNSPDGLTPWVFIKKTGYDYEYAGENLARGFTTSNSVVDAWMASPSHRENMLSPHYQDIGFAIVQGKLLGEDTTLVVEMFGEKTGVVAKPSSQERQIAHQSSNPEQALQIPSSSLLSAVNQKPLIDAKALSTQLLIIFAAMFVFILIVDIVVIERKQIVRVVGHSFDHAFFFGMIILMILVAGAGSIL